jgi:hypothetical protein
MPYAHELIGDIPPETFRSEKVRNQFVAALLCIVRDLVPLIKQDKSSKILLHSIKAVKDRFHNKTLSEQNFSKLVPVLLSDFDVKSFRPPLHLAVYYLLETADALDKGNYRSAVTLAEEVALFAAAAIAPAAYGAMSKKEKQAREAVWTKHGQLLEKFTKK